MYIDDLEKKREENYASPGRVCYYGRMYGCRGYSSKEIPEEFTYVGEVNNIGAKLLDEEYHHHLNGDVTGSLYANPERPDILYFDRADWNEEVDGKEEYLIMELFEDE